MYLNSIVMLSIQNFTFLGVFRHSFLFVHPFLNSVMVLYLACIISLWLTAYTLGTDAINVTFWVLLWRGYEYVSFRYESSSWILPKIDVLCCFGLENVIWIFKFDLISDLVQLDFEDYVSVSNLNELSEWTNHQNIRWNFTTNLKQANVYNIIMWEYVKWLLMKI